MRTVVLALALSSFVGLSVVTPVSVEAGLRRAPKKGSNTGEPTSALAALSQGTVDPNGQKAEVIPADSALARARAAQTPSSPSPAPAAEAPVVSSGQTSGVGSNGPHGIVWAAIPAGSFEMGCSPNDSTCDTDERPTHTVEVGRFRIMRAEVTQEQFQTVMGSNPSGSGACRDCPVERTSWTEADAFCRKVGARLPTEAEWEYAARARTRTRYACGDDPSCLDQTAICHEGVPGPKPVASRQANAFGLFDMSGNVWEWTADVYDEKYYASSPRTDPRGPSSGAKRAYRGGGYDGSQRMCRVTHRGTRSPDERERYIGFRCAAD